MRALLSIFAPFALIASELAKLRKEATAIRELYEAELAAREKPVYRITEEPGRSDTEVSFAGEEPKEKSALRRLLDGDRENEDDEM